MGFVQGDPAAIMIVEYAGDTEAEVRAKVEALEARRQRERFGYAAHVAHDAGRAAQSIWNLRKAGLGLLLGMKGDKKPIAFVEDTAVEPRHLAEFVPRFQEIFAKHDTVGAYYGHCSVGCLHIRPVIDLKTPRGIEQVRAIADEITDLVLEFGGTISSEHGDGRARSPFLERMYGPTHHAGVPPAQAGLRPGRPDEPRQHRRLARHPENLRYGVGLQDVGAHHAARLLGAGRLRGVGRDVQRRRRLPQEAGGHHVPVATWPRATRSTPRAAAPTRCGRCSRGGCRRRSSPASGSTR